jgi:hypothetical protein
MKERINPYFEVDGQKYELKATRYLIAEYQRIGKEVEISNEDKQNAVKAQNFIADIKKYLLKTKELEDKYFETFDDEDERRYLKAKALYENKLNELAKFEAETGSTTRLQEQGVMVLEKTAIKAIAEQYFDFNEAIAKELWGKFTETIDKETKEEWLSYMSDCLFKTNEEEVQENSFLSQMREKKLKQNNYKKK